MNDIDAKLGAIFVAAIPGLTPEAAAAADRDRLEGWDSIASVTLATMIEEEFGCSIQFDDVAEWNTYSDVRNSVAKSSYPS